MDKNGKGSEYFVYVGVREEQDGICIPMYLYLYEYKQHFILDSNYCGHAYACRSLAEALEGVVTGGHWEGNPSPNITSMHHPRLRLTKCVVTISPVQHRGPVVRALITESLEHPQWR